MQKPRANPLARMRVSDRGQVYVGSTFRWTILAAMLSPWILCLGFGGCDSRPKTGRTFKSDAWKNAVGEQAVLRKEMLGDLLAQHKIVGLSKLKVVQLLGEPDSKDRYSGETGGSDFNYYLGPEKGFISIDSEWLTIKFEEDRAVDVLVTTD